MADERVTGHVRVTDGAGSSGTVIRQQGRDIYVDWETPEAKPDTCPECGEPTVLRSGRLVCSNITCFWRRTP